MSEKSWRPIRRGGFPTHSIMCSTEAARNEPPTKVVFTLEKHGNLVKLTLTHENFAAGSRASGRHLQGMAGDPGQPQEPDGNRHRAGDPVRRARHRGHRMNIDQFKPMTVYTIYIASTPEKVWEALTSAEFSRKYFFGNSVEVELKVGGAYIVRTPDGALHISGEVIECDPPKKLTFTFNVNWPALIEKLGPTLVTYEIEPAGDAVRLTMTRVARPAAQRRYSFRRPPGLARDPVEPEERAGNGRAAGHQDGAAAADAGGAEGRWASRRRSPSRRPGERRGPYAVTVMREAVLVALSLPTRRNNGHLWLWVPAFAGTTTFFDAAVCRPRGHANRPPAPRSADTDARSRGRAPAA